MRNEDSWSQKTAAGLRHKQHWRIDERGDLEFNDDMRTEGDPQP